MTRQVIHLIPDVTLDDIRIDTHLKRPSPHVSPIASLMTRQVSSSGAVCGKDIILAINDLVFLYFITTPPTKVSRAIFGLRDYDCNKDERIFRRHPLWPAPCAVKRWTPTDARWCRATSPAAPKHHRKI
ncbi:hypothetical protein ACLOJK_004673 [Asimina triloba]